MDQENWAQLSQPGGVTKQSERSLNVDVETVHCASQPALQLGSAPNTTKQMAMHGILRMHYKDYTAPENG